MNIYINGKQIKLSPRKAIGKGGEADIFDIGKGKVAKIYKQPDHPDFQGLINAQQAAKYRLQEHQEKLCQFPQNLPPQIVAPETLVTDQTGINVLGYTMAFLKGTIPLLRYSDRQFRTRNGISNQTVIEIFQNLHKLLETIHQNQIIIGDFNDLNVLLEQTKPYLIDADSFQYGKFLCTVFTPRFVDPLLCDANGSQPQLNAAYTVNSDWYSFTVMLMQCLLFVDPYGGVYKPKNKQRQIPHTARSLKRITVFNPEVKYPKPAIPYQALSDDLLHYFQRCFQADQREKFPDKLLDSLTWKKCPSCGLEHARLSCPLCNNITIQITAPTTVIVKEKITARRIFETNGVILAVTLVGDNLNWLYYDQGAFKREDNTVIFSGELQKKLYFWLQNNCTIIGKLGQIVILDSRKGVSSLAVDNYQDQPMFSCNQFAYYWLHNGQLLKKGKIGSEYVGDVLNGQTQFWVGSRFGFGLYRAARLNVAFVFDTQRPGINDQVKLPNLSGELIDATCVFSEIYCWFFIAMQSQGKIIDRVFVIRADGTIIATEEVEKNSASWLSNIRGNFAISNFLLVATDEGIIRIEPHQNRIIKTQEFPDSEPFADANSHLFANSQGLYVVNAQKISLLKLS